MNKNQARPRYRRMFKLARTQPESQTRQGLRLLLTCRQYGIVRSAVADGELDHWAPDRESASQRCVHERVRTSRPPGWRLAGNIA